MRAHPAGLTSHSKNFVQFLSSAIRKDHLVVHQGVTLYSVWSYPNIYFVSYGEYIRFNPDKVDGIKYVCDLTNKLTEITKFYYTLRYPLDLIE